MGENCGATSTTYKSLLSNLSSAVDMFLTNYAGIPIYCHVFHSHEVGFFMNQQINVCDECQQT